MLLLLGVSSTNFNSTNHSSEKEQKEPTVSLEFYPISLSSMLMGLSTSDRTRAKNEKHAATVSRVDEKKTADRA